MSCHFNVHEIIQMHKIRRTWQAMISTLSNEPLSLREFGGSKDMTQELPTRKYLRFLELSVLVFRILYKTVTISERLMRFN